ncbi:unnamed protein product [Oppiella nova]|uniref:Motile sperm domain-containing protein 2 n=1 Tax=Oppiella nova TaxID=334625 RepID=A0A7R9LEX5_9ACAR|nr:unnamed protein product [Oppiella nova]CAG2162973.1 unnamed protein product [Oppiella nova]
MTIITKQHSNKSGELVIQVRQRFLEDYTNNPDVYNEEDVERIRTNDWYVKRFLLARRRNVDEAYEMLRNTIRWRQEFGLPTMIDTDFPTEFYKVGGLFQYERDLSGNVVIYLRIRMHRKIAEMSDPIKRFLMHIVDKTDRQVDGNGMVIVFDCSGAGYSNMDLDFLTFLITAGNSYFPVGLKYILVYELSWLLNAFRRIAMSLIPQTFLPLIKFADKSDITNYISLDNLPDFMGGTCKRNYRYIPKGCPTVADIAAKNGYTQEDIDRILPIFEPLLAEADKAIADNNYLDTIDNNEEITIGSIEMNEKIESNGTISENLVPINKTNSKPNILGLFPNDLMHFIYESHSQTYETNILLQNLCETPIAYKIQSNNPNNYNVSPRLGIIMFGASLRCNIQLISGRRHHPKDKFLIIALPINDHKLNVNQFARLWKDNKESIISYKLLTNMNEKNNHLGNDGVEGEQDLRAEMCAPEVFTGSHTNIKS